MNNHPVFPCAALPQDPAAGRLLGVYPQVQEGLYLQRVKVLGGDLTAAQWQAVGKIAQDFSPGVPLHLTTRQDMEIHDLPAGAIPAVQQALSAAALSGAGSCGDTVRNFTVCPCSGRRAGKVDLVPLAWQLRKLAEATEGVYSLPRKFKVSLSACEKACAQPYINDLGLVATQRDGRWGFRVIGAGSLGSRPGLGIELFEWLAAADVPPLLQALLAVFAAEGDRTNRGKARLRHVRERMGDAAFVSLVHKEFERAKDSCALSRDNQQVPPSIAAKRSLGVPSGGHPQASTLEGGTCSSGHQQRSVGGPQALDLIPLTTGLAAKRSLIFINGDVSAAAACALGVLAGTDGLAVRIANQHRVIVWGKSDELVAAAVASQPALASAAAPGPTLVACPGKRWCKRGLLQTAPLAQRLGQALAGKIADGGIVCISGCPNGCSQHTVAPIGVTGGLATVDGVKQEVYTLFTGGKMGRTADLAKPAGTKLSEAELIRLIISPPQRGS